jgi:hypothetical protein
LELLVVSVFNKVTVPDLAVSFMTFWAWLEFNDEIVPARLAPRTACLIKTRALLHILGSLHAQGRVIAGA